MLRLHHLAKNYSERGLRESLETLSPYLSSDKHKLYVVVDYVLNCRKQQSCRFVSDSANFANIGKDLDFQNNQIGDLLFLFNNNKNTILTWVRGYLKDQGLPLQYQNIILNLLNLFLRIISDKPMPNMGDKLAEELQQTVNFLMNIEVKGNSAKSRLE